MAWFRRKRNKTASGAAVSDRGSSKVDREHLTDFVQTRQGVEGFVEPQTTVTQTTLLLVAKDGEWTRRRVPSAEWAHKFANDLQVPSYDAAVVGYPQRMRDYNHRQKLAAKEAVRKRDAGE
ncbi:hypothetical protein [Solicola gregarius]|uniref:Uncharacterized protein n=1 Tax=Solicola gregarius TaxID=2908642 RepID=A0AA46THG8_9ACTN|nr:hypothetical protein [Solicola gregarius]UYM05437.1 hypothetical protein L0C25_23495 [Solicola gregarius]